MAKITLDQAFTTALTAAKNYIDNFFQNRNSLTLKEYSTNKEYVIKIVNGKLTIEPKS